MDQIISIVNEWIFDNPTNLPGNFCPRLAVFWQSTAVEWIYHSEIGKRRDLENCSAIILTLRHATVISVRHDCRWSPCLLNRRKLTFTRVASHWCLKYMTSIQDGCCAIKATKAVTGQASSYVSGGHNLLKAVSETTKRKKLPIP